MNIGRRREIERQHSCFSGVTDSLLRTVHGNVLLYLQLTDDAVISVFNLCNAGVRIFANSNRQQGITGNLDTQRAAVLEVPSVRCVMELTAGSRE